MLTLLFRNYLYHRFKAIRYIQKSIHGKICNTSHIKPRLQYKLEGRMPEKKYPCQAFYCLINTPVALHTWFVVNVIAIFSILFVYFVVSVAVPFQGILSHGIYCIYLLVFNEFLICNFANQFLIVLMFYSYYIYIHHYIML